MAVGGPRQTGGPSWGPPAIPRGPRGPQGPQGAPGELKASGAPGNPRALGGPLLVFGYPREVSHEELFHCHRWSEAPAAAAAAAAGKKASAAAAAAAVAAGEWLPPRLIRCRDTAAVLLQQQQLQQQGWDISSSRAQQELFAAAADSNRGALWGPYIPAPHLHYSPSSSSSSSCSSRSNFVAYLLPLRANEWVAVRRAVWFRVLRGLAECRGHLFPPSVSYSLVAAEGPAAPSVSSWAPTHSSSSSSSSSSSGCCSSDLRSGTVAAGAPGIRITALPGPDIFGDLPQQQQQQQQQQQDAAVAAAFLEDFTSARFAALAFLDSFDCGRHLGCIDTSGGPQGPLASSGAPAALRLLQLDNRLQQNSLVTQEVQQLLDGIDEQPAATETAAAAAASAASCAAPQVYLLDADVGQPICCAPGSVSLLSVSSSSSSSEAN
ncbi:hypothetical protein, conserved [Eimeria tenella]|uniref:Uncharacterized protein n=1 Tax=Eimeria tenella TaxID=5802 RepID=U6KHC2_EIMTE|nr:hypothetical protein, conserved [Eimeria tenella]CDJ37410.1 hypothetical protein, conserved [Eimeria tenella]|eukprot:XP_013228248.1 hypothetical protein, conserved [Eimeria tenella]